MQRAEGLLAESEAADKSSSSPSSSSSSSSSSDKKKKKKKKSKSKKAKKSKKSKKKKGKKDGVKEEDAEESPADKRRRERAEAAASKTETKRLDALVKLANDVLLKTQGVLASLQSQVNSPAYAGMPSVVSEQVATSVRSLQGLQEECNRCVLTKGHSPLSISSINDIGAVLAQAKRIDSLLSGMILQVNRLAAASAGS